ncbi:MAG: hypothetical protein LBQ55_08615 [Treponema sp.]|jgi:hypothetical protein|nr:hypothetical protein [Treponema sp.]
MKNVLKKMRVLSFSVIMLAGCGGIPSANSSPGGLAIDTAIEQAAARIEKAFNAGTEIALISVSSPSAQFSEYVLTYLESILVNNGKLAVVDRANLDKIRAEQGFQLSGDVSDESAKAIGKMLGAGAIVTGTLVNLGDAYRLTLKAINVETARVAASYPADITNSPRVQTLLAGGGGTSGGTQAGNTGGTTARAPAAPAVPAYKIGDTGPAGGIVFYDKGNNSGGWRYLEAAPVGNEFKAQWGERDVTTGTELGTGKDNTQRIRVVLEQEGALTRAAPRCAQLNINGFTDWFLPSKAELAWMYVNLKSNNLGDFSNDWYWSSSDVTDDGLWNGAWSQRFIDGHQEGSWVHNKAKTYSVRAIRQF